MAGGRWEGQALELLEKVAGPGVPEKHREILQERLGPIEVVVDGAMRLSGERYALREGQEWILAGRTRGQAIHHLHYGGGECFGVREGVTGEGAKATFARLDEWNQRMEQAEENFTWEYSVEGEDGEALSEEDEIAKLEAEAAREEAARDDAYRWEAYEERDRILEEDHVEYVMVAYDEEMDTGQWGDTWIPVEVEDPSGIADLEEAAKRALERHPPELIEKGGVWVVAGAFGKKLNPWRSHGPASCCWSTPGGRSARRWPRKRYGGWGKGNPATRKTRSPGSRRNPGG